MKKKLLFALSGIAFILAACGNSGGAEDVRVNLNEFGVQSSRTEFEAGIPYRFIIKNEGKIPHELMIMKPIPAMEGMEMPPMEELDSLALAVVEEDELPAGARYTLEFTFPESAVGADLEFACHTPGHYEAGMKLPITVK